MAEDFHTRPNSIITIIIEDKGDGTIGTVMARNIHSRRHAEVAIELIRDSLLHQLDLDTFAMKDRS